MWARTRIPCICSVFLHSTSIKPLVLNRIKSVFTMSVQKGSPKVVFTEELAAQALADLEVENHPKVIKKLQAIASAAKYPVTVVADITHVSTQTLREWAHAYHEKGLEGLHPKVYAARATKLSPEQKNEILKWVDECRTPQGELTHWTLERLRFSINESFGVTLGINTIWVWLRKENRKLKAPRTRQRKTGDPVKEEP